jgi:CBS domain-containing protein
MSNFSKIAATPIRDVGAGPLLSVSPDTPLLDVVTAMRDRRCGAALVVDTSGIAGIFTERDLLKRVDHRNLAWHAMKVREVMTPNPVTVRETQTIEDAINLMTVGSFRHLPVVDPEGRPLSLISIREILACMVEFYPQEFVNLPPDPGHEATGRWGG